MSKILCYNPLKCDREIAAKINNPKINEHRVALWRALYDASHKESLDISDIDKAALSLMQFSENLKEQHSKEYRTKSKDITKTLKDLKEAFPSTEERTDRINMVSTLFSMMIDGVQKKNSSLTREQITNGVIVNGSKVAGQVAIFEAIFNKIVALREEAISSDNKEKADKYSKVLENWSSIVTLSKYRLRDTEGLKLGDKYEYADEANDDNFGDNIIADLYDVSESTKESWQETNDMRSSFGSVGQEVRRLIGSIQEIKEGVPQKDDLGFPKMLNPVKCHQSLLEILSGCTSSRQMIGELEKAAKVQSWIAPIVFILQSKGSNRLKTQFFVDFIREFQPYSIMMEVIENDIKKFKTKILNRPSETLSSEYMTKAALAKQLDSKVSIYDKDGNINWGNVRALQSLVKDWFTKDPNNAFSKVSFYDKYVPVKEKIKALSQITKILNIDVSKDTLKEIIFNPESSKIFTKAIQDFVNFGINGYLTDKEQAALSEGRDSELDSKKSFMEFLTRIPESSTSKEGVAFENIRKMLTVITKHREGLRLESRVRHKDKNGNSVTRYSHVNPSYLGDVIRKVQNFVKNKDEVGLKRWIETEFLNSPYFVMKVGEQNVILNTWIRELYYGGVGEDSFAANFTFDRFLGTSDESFENFTSKKHAIAMFSQYFSDRQINKKSQYAHYPIFILGDSGVAKFIKAKRYNREFILNGLYNIYQQELQRQKLTRDANEKMTSEGYKLLENFSEKADVFTILPFLNKDYKSSDGKVGKYAEMLAKDNSLSSVKSIIASYMEEAIGDFKKNLAKIDVIGFDENGATVDKNQLFAQELTGNRTLNDILDEYYWNTKFATINQLQMMTIDTAYYVNTKDLQKRYKEIHAPGTILDISALDDNDVPYSADGIERCIYFDDISLDGEKYDPAFMKAIEHHFGKNSAVYKKYKKNTLTDGQGYRSLDSCRKVMGMAGKWTPDMEAAYREIKALRAKYKDTNPSSEDLARIGELAVVFQPIKPYLYGIENYSINGTDKLKIPVQHKYAEVILIPELLPAGSMLRDMAEYMETEHVDKDGKPYTIDMVCSTKAVKVGNYGSADISNLDRFGEGFTNKERLDKALGEGKVHQLKYSDYRIQTNVPEHINSSQLFGTQIRKLIMAGLTKGKDYSHYTGGKKVKLYSKANPVSLTDINLIAFYNSLIVANILESYGKFKDSAGNIKALSEKLIQNVLSNSRESLDNLLAFSLNENGDFTIPLFEGGLEHDAAALSLSLFKKIVNKQKIKGGSAVQASALGIKGYEESGELFEVVDLSNTDNILYTECEMPFDFNYTDSKGNKVNLKYEDYVEDNPNSNASTNFKLDTSEEITSDHPDFKEYQSFYITDENGVKHYYRPLIEKHFPKILDLIAYRIPTEDDYSMLRLKIKRVSPKIAGGTIKVPANGTTKSGFDFK